MHLTPLYTLYIQHWIQYSIIPLRPIRHDSSQYSTTMHTLDIYFHIQHQYYNVFSWGTLSYVIIEFCWWSRTCLDPVLTQRLAYISSLRLNSSLCSVWLQMEKWNVIGYRKWPFSLQQTNCQALHMKKGLKMQLADVHVMLAMWVSGEWDPWIIDVHKTHTVHKMSTHSHVK